MPNMHIAFSTLWSSTCPSTPLRALCTVRISDICEVTQLKGVFEGDPALMFDGVKDHKIEATQFRKHRVKKNLIAYSMVEYSIVDIHRGDV